jgi:hypothetical protein
LAEPDPVDILTAQLEELRGQLARSQGEIGHLKARLETGSGQVAMFRLEVKQLREELAKAASKHQLKPPPAPWWCVDQAAGEVMLADLRKWVETFLQRHYPGYLARLPRCWERHPEAVWELSTLRAEWERVYGDEDNRDLRGALDWHDRYLPGVINRLAGSMKCDELGCRAARPHR